jgi:ribosomal protein S18 acetylase RimI-like enzyme
VTSARHGAHGLAERALNVNAGNLALGHEVFQADGATFVRNHAFPRIYDANHVGNITAATQPEIDTLLERIEREYDSIGHRALGVDSRTPPSLAARLALDGYERRDSLVLLLEGELTVKPRDCDIRPVESEMDWKAYAELHAIDWRENMERHKEPVDASVQDQMWRSHRAKQPPVQHFLAYAGDRPVAFFNSWAGTDGIGQVENLFTHPDFRHRGLATALIHHCVADARRKGAGPIVIVADPTDTPKHMYAAMGFRPVAIYYHYLKRLDQAPPSPRP